MSLGIRKTWVIGAVLLLALVVLLGWAWRDGGQEPLRELSAQTNLPTVVQ